MRITEKQLGYIKGLLKQTKLSMDEILNGKKLEDLNIKEASLVIETLLKSNPKSKSKKNQNTDGTLEPIRIHFDGGSSPNPGHGASAAVFIANNKVIDTEAEYLGDGVTNNFAELTAMKLAFNLYKRYVCDYEKITIYSDSTYAIGCVDGSYKKIKKNKEIIFDLKLSFSEMKTDLVHVLRDKNTIADELVNKIRDEHLNEN